MPREDGETPEESLLLPHESDAHGLLEEPVPGSMAARRPTERHGWLHQAGVAFMWLFVIYTGLNGVGSVAAVVYLLTFAPPSLMAGAPSGTVPALALVALYWGIGAALSIAFAIGARPWSRWALIAWWAALPPVSLSAMAVLGAFAGMPPTDLALLGSAYAAMVAVAIAVFASSPGRLHVSRGR